MKKKIIVISLIVFTTVLFIPYILNKYNSDKLIESITILSGISSFITVIIAFLFFDKFGIEKSIKDKNLDTTLKLLETIKKTSVFIVGDNYYIQYRPATFGMESYEHSYSIKLIFSVDYHEELAPLKKYADNIYLPKEVKGKLVNIIPSVLGKSSKTIDISMYGKVSIGNHKHKDSKWEYDELNEEQVTLFDYLLKWEELVTNIQDWCMKNSDSKIDLNIN
jgi:hypothetical protein